MGFVQERPDRKGKIARYRGPDGRERSKTFKRKGDADDFLEITGADMQRKRWVDPRRSREPFNTYAEGWFATKLDVRQSTLDNIEGRLNRHILPAFGSMALEAIRPEDARNFVKQLLDKGLAASTIHGIFRTFGQIMEQAEDDTFIARNPCRKMKLPSIGEVEEQRYLTATQVELLANSIDPRYRGLVLTAAYGGLRYGELAALEIKRVDLLHGSISVMQSLYETKAGKLIIGPTKTGKARKVPIGRGLARVLERHLEDSYSWNGYVFPSAGRAANDKWKSLHGEQPGYDRLLRHSNWYGRHYQKAVRVSGLAPLRFHDLRHTAAALLIAKGHSLHEVKKYLGHSSIRVTSDRYGHLYEESHDSIRNSQDDLLVATIFSGDGTNAGQSPT